MATPLYDRLNGPQQPPMQNPIFNRFGGFNNFMQLYNAYASGQMGLINPEMLVKSMLQNGQTSKELFDQAIEMASQMTGRRYY